MASFFLVARGEILKLSRSSFSPQLLRYSAGVAICAGVATLLWAGHQLRLEMQQDTQRAMQMLAGGRNVGANRLQVPMLRRASFPKVAQQQRSMAAAADQALGALDVSKLKFKGQNVILSFVGMMPSSNHDINNYIVFGVRQKLVAAGAGNVLVSYPSTTYQLGQSQPEAGVVSELDNVLALARDTQLSAGAVKGADPVFLKIKQAGVDTYDRSAFTPTFYIRAFLLSMLALLGVAALSYALIERRWPQRRRLNAVVSTGIALLSGLNLLIWIFYSANPNLPSFKVVSAVSLSLAAFVDGQLREIQASGSDAIVVGGPQVDDPAPIGGVQIYAPAEGGVVRIIPPLPVP